MSFSGESDDDHEELYMAASSARNASSMHFTLLIHTHTHTVQWFAARAADLHYISIPVTKVLVGFCRPCMLWSILEENGINFWFSQFRGHILLEAAGNEWDTLMHLIFYEHPCFGHLHIVSSFLIWTAKSCRGAW